ncbi:DinB family protein [Paenibacillus montanisoli]|uniref:DinB family protein n=1 Tax=Paenibacillus montanisoli TaxID=2081970 RepID=A0A328TWT4_9BACL|nr:DinB family protein [Paenibacillus montanisoli]RAP74947.1 DinB family protein [Paenibacillus montanisoli]
MLTRPSADEFGAHFGTYIALPTDGDLLEQLEASRSQTTAMFSGLTDEQALFRYSPGKWSIKELLGHIVDTERIMSYRLLRVARGDQTPLPGFDENEFVSGASFDSGTVAELVEEYNAVRGATLALLRGLTPEAFLRKGTASNTGISARALAYVIAGHELHHVNVVRERYLNR